MLNKTQEENEVTLTEGAFGPVTINLSISNTGSQKEKKSGLTAHQNKEITEALCRLAAYEWLALNDSCAEILTKVRCALVAECVEINRSTSAEAK